MYVVLARSVLNNIVMVDILPLTTNCQRILRFPSAQLSDNVGACVMFILAGGEIWLFVPVTSQCSLEFKQT